MGSTSKEVGMKAKTLLSLILLMICMVHCAYSNNEEEHLFPGNLVSVNLFGNKLVSKDYRLDSKGFITFPDVGSVNCSNQTVSGCRILTIKKLASIYKNASTLTLSKKSNDIYISVLGLVKKPGLYLASPDTSFQVVLQKAGGLSDGAQMDRIQVRRSGQVTVINYRKFLDDGDNKLLPQLTPMDEIFVPGSKLISNVNINAPLLNTTDKSSSWLDTSPSKSVKVMGAISKPGRYVWSSEMSLLDLLAEAGGPIKDADTNNITIITTPSANQKSRTIKFNLTRFMEQGGNLKSIPTIKAGYIINIPSLPTNNPEDKANWINQDPKTVIYVFGEVKKPGRYNFDNKLNFLDILSAADGPTDKADLHDVHLIDRQGIHPQVVHVNLSLYFETGDPELIPAVLSGDAVYVPQVNQDYSDVKSKHIVKILGEVAKPGRYRYTSNMTILDLLSAAGGPTSQAWIKKILIVNIGPNLETKSSVFDLMKFSKTGDLRMLPTIREGDVIYVPNSQESSMKKFNDGLQILANLALILSYGRGV